MALLIVNAHHVLLLEQKSRENYQCALQADSDNRYNVAVSRLYYSCLILTKRCLIELGWKTEEEMKACRGSSHKFIIDSYVNERHADTNTPDICKTHLLHIRSLKKYRQKADYSATYDYTIPRSRSDYINCRKMAEQYIGAIETLHHIKIK